MASAVRPLGRFRKNLFDILLALPMVGLINSAITDLPRSALVLFLRTLIRRFLGLATNLVMFGYRSLGDLTSSGMISASSGTSLRAEATREGCSSSITGCKGVSGEENDSGPALGTWTPLAPTNEGKNSVGGGVGC